jgi:enamine deaminase RidA (YjgF/YER057c/UK114 family)
MTCWNHDTIFLSGHLPIQMDGTIITGRLGADFKVEDGYNAARWCGLNLISSLQKELGDLDRVEQIVKLFGIVRSADGFTEQHLVVNGCSDVLMQVFGKDKAFHARSAIGSNSLPLGAAVEVEAIVRVKRQ